MSTANSEPLSGRDGPTPYGLEEACCRYESRKRYRELGSLPSPADQSWSYVAAKAVYHETCRINPFLWPSHRFMACAMELLVCRKDALLW